MNPFLASNPASSASDWYRTFLATFVGLGFETLPFLLIGTFLAALIANLIPVGRIKGIFPRNPWLSILAGLGLGFVLPICECATIPLARRLRDEGLPESTALAFLLAAPIVNPLTLASTVVAYRGTGLPMTALRLGVGLCVAVVMAAIVETGAKARRADPVAQALAIPGGLGARAGFQRTRDIPQPQVTTSIEARLVQAARLTAVDFLDSCRYLVVGIFVAAVIRAVLGDSFYALPWKNPLVSLGGGAASAYVLSLCSSADAFVARSLFGTKAVLASVVFLALGPMLDIKNTLLLSRILPARRLAMLVVLVVLLAAGFSVLATGILGSGQ